MMGTASLLQLRIDILVLPAGQVQRDRNQTALPCICTIKTSYDLCTVNLADFC